MRKYEKQPARELEHMVERKRKRDSSWETHIHREREREFMWDQNKEKKWVRDEEKDNKWNDAPYDGWSRVPSATWNYISKEKVLRGALLTQALGLADFPVRKMLYPIRCGEAALWQMHPSYMKEAIAAIIKHNVIQPTYTKATAFRCHGGANSESRTEMCMCVCLTVCYYTCMAVCRGIISLWATKNGLVLLL